MQQCIDELGVAGGTPSTLGTKGTVKNLADAEDILLSVESKNFQGLAGRMLHHSSDDPTIHFEMPMAMSGMCKPTVGAAARLMRVTRHCIDRPTLSWRFIF